MSDAAARRRELQRRAFALDGRLTEAEAAELRELSAPEQEPVPEPVSESAPAPALAEGERGSGSPSATGGRQTPESSPQADRPARRHTGIPVLIVAAVVAVLLGVGGGWLLFGRAAGAPPLTDAQRDTLVQLDSSDEFDAGSVALVGAEDGVEVWYATKKVDESECMVLVAGDDRHTTCRRVEDASMFGLQANMNTEIDGEQYMVWAVMLEDSEGDRVSVIQRDRGSGQFDWSDQYTGRDLEIAEFLDANGYPGDNLQLIGYDDVLPIWMTYQGDQLCMVIAEPTALTAEACASFGPEGDGRLDMSTDRATYQLNVSSTVGPTLTIVRTPDSIICDTDSGYCGVDDRTAETEG